MLKLGKSFDRNYNLRLSFMEGYYNIGVFINKKSTFLLFDVEADFPNMLNKNNVKINMFKNLESSKFCETFLDLHSYRNKTLDIVNQYKGIKDEYSGDINFILNETIILSKIDIMDKTLYDKLFIYGLTMSIYPNEFIYLITERHNVVSKLNKKIVRTSAIQIATTASLESIKEYHEYKPNYSLKK